ncbi:hypothetical protein A1O3_05323 [Capronia epimyces CBS 606.96]|uniref:Uncharacterized protein n=1 Tax=Capronia epimyces CBS 606.96 TaxID=1182542 RepID=W9XWN9_9EURO|nr:uncharacterized protein A1O3_05323 [Capronia epimyces CBS 606.96]EXJ84653.1 hypothetical protein A1O3_05323 [Capronia epimyces CBS 606.96]
MKDILITLQQAVITHLREVYMDEVSLDLHSLKEMSDDSRVNATVCLGQLYQRMSTATAAMKQISRPPVDEPSKTPVPESLTHSSSRSTHSSLGGGHRDNQSMTSHTTYSSRTAICYDRKASGGPMPQRAISLNSALSDSNEREHPTSVTPGEDNVPALPCSTQIQVSQGAMENTSGGVGNLQHVDERIPPPNAVPPPAYKPTPSSPIQGPDEKGQTFPRESSFYQPPTAHIYNSVPQNMPLPRVHGTVSDRNGPRRLLHPQVTQIYELDDGSLLQTHSREQEMLIPAPQPSSSHAVPLNPDYSTLEYVVDLEARSRPPGSPVKSQLYRRHTEQLEQQWQPQMQRAYYPEQVVYGQQWQSGPIVRRQTSEAETESGVSPVGPVSQARVPQVPPAPRPLSIRSSSSTESKLGAFTLRRALPPGIAEAIHKSAPSGLEWQPRYVKPDVPGVSKEQTVPLVSPASPVGHQGNSWSDGVSMTSTPSRPPLESSMRAPTLPHLQIARSELNLPSESNLAGFCKGAVRTQLGGRKKGFSLEHNRKRKGQAYFFRCTKCNFEGPAAVSTALPSGGRGAVKREKTFDTRVRMSEGGIKYRWAFLAKSHVLNKATSSDLDNSTDVFGCYFCCAEGAAKGWVDDTLTAQLATLGSFGDRKTSANLTPIFTGLRAFLAHLETHRTASRTPGLVVANEMNCIIGRTADDREDFDLNLPPP